MRLSKLSSLLIFCWAASSLGAAQHFSVYLMGGQSNMSGSRFTTEPSELPANLQSPQTDVAFFSSVARPQIPQTFSLTGNLQPYTDNPSNPSFNYFGPEVSFGRALADGLPNQNIAIIKYSADGTSLFNDWKADFSGNPMQHGDEGYHFTQFQATVSSGLSFLAGLNGGGNTYEIAGMVWVQGEADANNDRLDYLSNLSTFTSQLRADYGMNLPFFFSRLSANQDFSSHPAGYSAVRNAQESFAAGDTNAFLVDTDSLVVVQESFGKLHYDSSSQVILGQSLASQAVAIPEPTGLVLIALAASFGGFFLLRSKLHR